MPSAGPDGYDDADLPGLDDAPAPAAQPETPAETVGSPGPDPTTTGAVAEAKWSRAELDEWFESGFGGDDAFWDFYSDGDGHLVTATSHPDLHFGLTAYRQLQYDENLNMPDEAEPWRRMSLEAKTRFRRGWENSQTPAGAAAGELAPYAAMETLVDARHDLNVARSTKRRWIWIGGGGVLGLVLAVGVFLPNGDGDQEDGTPATTIASTAPASTEAASTDETQAPAAVGDTSDQPIVSFPTRWSYTATKSAVIVPAPDFITPTPIGTALPWAFDLIETCEEACSYATVIYPLIPEALLGDVPEATWVVDGAEWSLDATYQTIQSHNADGTVCVIRNHDVFELTVTGLNDQSLPATFTGSWTQATGLDLEASTGDTASYCGEVWEVVDEWTVEGVAAN